MPMCKLIILDFLCSHSMRDFVLFFYLKNTSSIVTLAHTSEVRMEHGSSFKERNEFYSSYPPELSSTSAFNYYA